nr:uncharacterized protein LOC107447953 isoform X2 [Parasteatoda tepidariorum]
MNFRPDLRNKPHSASFTNLQISESFSHFRSVSYFQAVTNASISGSQKSFDTRSSIEKSAIGRIPSISTPCTPKKIEIEKYSTLPVTTSNNSCYPSKKTRSSSLSSFFRKLKPRFHRSSSDGRNPWIVIEFASHDSDDVSSVSDSSDHSVELAVKSKVQHFTSLKDLYDNSNDICNCALSNKRKDSSSLSPKCNLNSNSVSKTSVNFDCKSQQGAHNKSESSIFFRLSPRRRLENLKHMLKNFSKRRKCRNSPSMFSLDSRTCTFKSESCLKSDYTTTSGAFSSFSQIENDRASPTFHFCNQSKQENLRSLRHSADISYLLRIPNSRSSNSSLSSVLEDRSSEDKPLTNGFKPDEKKECSIAEIKLPSYVSISCAINGYTSYSRFCRSRENSPARNSFRKSSLEPSMLADMNRKDSFDHHSNCKYSRSQSDCNGTMQSIYTESRHVTVSKQLQIPLKSSKKYITELSLSNGHSSIAERTEVTSPSKKPTSNGVGNDSLLLAKEVGNGGTKSLVQQRIESLYGRTVGEEVNISLKNSNKTKDSVVNNGDNSITPVLNGKSHTGSVSPPVFRHLNKDFRKQLQQGNIPNNKTEKEKPVLKPLNTSRQTSEKQVFSQKENFSPIINGVGHDECDRVKSMTPPPIKSFDSSDKRKIAQSNDSEREGYKFLNLIDIEKEKIELEVKKLEVELKNNPSIPEEASGKIRAACGKANLLMTQKFEQFRGLCWKNIEEIPGVPFYTTASDLAGFWDLVLLQVDDITSTFKDIEAMKNNGWKEIVSEKPATSQPKFRHSVANAVSRSNPTTPKRSAKSSELMKAREEARKQLLAAKKKGRQQAVANDDEIAIFAPAPS